MFWWLLSGKQRSLRITQILRLRQEVAVQGPSIQSGLPRNYPIEYARATDAYMYMATGLGPVTKWDGLSLQVELSGVAAPTTALTLSFTGTGGSITGNYQAYTRFLDGNGNVSNLSPVTDVIVATEATTAVYSNVPVPTTSNVVRRQILRNTAGSLLVFYVDVDTVNLYKTDFTSTNTDESLRLNTPVALFDPELNLNIANFHDTPPNDKPFISYYQNRLWLYGIVNYSEGHAQVTSGSATVTIIGGDVNSYMAERLLYIDGADRYYTISSVSDSAQTITISESYKGITDKWASYTITPTPERRHLLCYSEPAQFDSWRAEQNIEIASSDDMEDDGTGLVSTQSFLFILQRRHIYRLTYFEDPVIDGGIWLSARRGCINNRCWVAVDNWLYLLDDKGIYRFSGSEEIEEISVPIQDLFYFDRPEGDRRINWSAARFFHASHDRNDSTIRWFVAFSGSRYPRHAICFNYAEPQWWIEEYQWAVGDSTILKEVNPVPVITTEAHRNFAVGVGTLDNLAADDGDTRIKATGAKVRSITASTDYTLPSTLAGVTLGVVAGKGKHQTRVITEVSGREIFVDRPWSEKPDETSYFQLGAIPYTWKSNWIRWKTKDTESTRRIVLSFDPITVGTSDLRIYEDYSKSPRQWKLDWPINANAGSGVTTEVNNENAVIDLSQTAGYAYLQLDHMKEFQVWRKDVIAVEVRGYSGEEPIQVYAIDVEGGA